MCAWHLFGWAFQPVLDTGAFATCDAGSALRGPEPVAELARALADEVSSLARRTARVLNRLDGSSTCLTEGPALCVNRSRFEINVDWATAQGGSGQGQAKQLTDDTGYF